MVRSNEEEIAVMQKALKNNEDCHLILIGGLWRLLSDDEYKTLRNDDHLHHTHHFIIVPLYIEDEMKKNRVITEDFCKWLRAKAWEERDWTESRLLNAYESATRKTELLEDC